MAGWSNVSEKLCCQLTALAECNTPSTSRPTWNHTSSVQNAAGQVQGEKKTKQNLKLPLSSNKRKVHPLYSIVISFVSYEVSETQSELNSFCWLKAEQDGLNHYHVFKCRVKTGMHPWKIKTGASSAPFQQPLQLEGIAPVLVTSLSTGKAPGKLAVKDLN